MKVTRILASLLLLAAVTGTASAVPAVRISWDNCTPLIINKDITPGSTASLFASVGGQDQGHKGYEIQMRLGTGSAPLPDAWRFDADGCQGPALVALDHLPSGTLVKTCPAMQGNLQSVQVKAYDYDASSGKARIAVFNTYPAGQPTANPATRYFMARAGFDHSFSVDGETTPGVDCGRLAAPICVHGVAANWLDINGATLAFAYENEFVNSRDPNNLSRCPGATPTQPITWGKIKDQYVR
jgi:hypothetical protein